MPPPEPLFHFLAVNDLHYQDGRCRPWLERVVRQMRAQPEQPAFCLVLGDLVEHGRPDQLAAARGLLDALELPVYVVPGNHDYTEAQDRSAFDRLFPHSRNYHFEHEGWQFVGFDTTIGTAWEHVAVPDATLVWLDRTLPELDPARPLVGFTHFPLNPTARMAVTNWEAVLTRFRNHRLAAVLCGHFHAETEARWHGALLATSRCCAISRENHDGTEIKGYSLCAAHPDGTLTRRFIEVPL